MCCFANSKCFSDGKVLSCLNRGYAWRTGCGRIYGARRAWPDISAIYIMMRYMSTLTCKHNGVADQIYILVVTHVKAKRMSVQHAVV